MGVLINARHERYAQNIAKGMEQMDAYEAAGFERNAGNPHRLRNNALVSQRIEEILGNAAAKVEITQARIMEELGKIAFANMADFMQIGEDGEPFLDFTGMDRDQAAAISELVVEDYYEGRGEDAKEVKRVRYKLSDKQGALEKLAKILGMFTTKIVHSGTVAHEHMNADEARVVVARFLEQHKASTEGTKH